jgi:hypothetical protein
MNRMNAIVYDPYDREQMKDPWPVYRRLRNEAPAYYMEKYDAWVLSRFADIQQASLDREHYTATQGIATGNLLQKRLMPDSASFMSMDPPRHTGYRKAVSSLFRPSTIARAMPAFVGARIAHHGSKLLANGSFDAVKQLALPVATEVSAHIVGIPIEDSHALVRQVEQFEPYFHDVPPPSAAMAVASSETAAGAVDLLGYLVQTVAEHRRRGPTPDNIIGLLMLAEPDGQRLDDRAIAENALPLFIGGMETFPKHFGSLLYWLDVFPEQRRKLAANRDLLGNALEEAMRFDAPAPLLGRRVIQPVQWHGHMMRPGQALMFLFQAANRDERVFERPDEFDIEREIKQQIAFGTGIHVCLGQHTARLESRMLLEWLLEKVPDYEVDLANAQRGLLAGMHGFRSLPVSAV